MNSLKPNHSAIIGDSPAMRKVYEQIDQIANYDVLVLLSGESGTGKDLVAQAIHDRSARRNGAYVPVNMGAIPKDLIGSTLFGHEKGAFTGASAAQKGLFETAHNGSLFLDEISTTDALTQVSLLRVIESHRFQRIGGTEFHESNARLVAATNTDLVTLTETGEFRSDLYHRLNVFSIYLPPLCRRGEDILLLSREFIRRYNSEFGKNVERISEEAVQMLMSYSWPGNVRELENVILRAVISASGTELTADLLAGPVIEDTDQPDREPEVADEGVTITVGTSLDDAEREIIRMTVAETGGNKGEAARILGISRKGIYNKIKKYGLQ